MQNYRWNSTRRLSEIQYLETDRFKQLLGLCSTVTHFRKFIMNFWIYTDKKKKIFWFKLHKHPVIIFVEISKILPHAAKVVGYSGISIWFVFVCYLFLGMVEGFTCKMRDTEEEITFSNIVLPRWMTYRCLSWNSINTKKCEMELQPHPLWKLIQWLWDAEAQSGEGNKWFRCPLQGPWSMGWDSTHVYLLVR